MQKKSKYNILILVPQIVKNIKYQFVLGNLSFSHNLIPLLRVL